MRRNKLEILEALRGLAALYVVFHHMTLNQTSWWAYPLQEGQAAVILFFVLSGFVIYYSSQKITAKKISFSDYFIKRFRRIYPLFIASMIVAYIARCFIMHTLLPLDDGNLAGNLINLQDIKRIPNNWFQPYYGNNPLWSLSYEWWFYILFFPIFKYIKEKLQIIVALGISVFGFITFILYNNKISITLEYFFIWWSGVEIARAWLAEGNISRKTYINVFGGYLIMIVLCGLTVVSHKGKLNVEAHPVIELRHFFFGITIITIGILWRRIKFIGYKYILKPFLLFSSISYGIYVFHAPLTYRNSSLFVSGNLPMDYLIGFIATIILAYVFEVPVQKFINNITKKFLKKDFGKIEVLDIGDDNKLLPG